MSRGLLFWLLVILTIIFGLWWSFPMVSSGTYAPLGMTILELVLFSLLGWQVFGPALKG
jgi:hypothetical protein